ncbi:MAG: cobyrinate a,c-diamide synthase [Proteobacteria bacterium]|nr:cobyrinate a,c-diamide synthase [Pseudomonadota bacterium]MBU1638990.1 cobyrinate a,c-diamide synthase [Pseudomonadota bacterium]
MKGIVVAGLGGGAGKSVVAVGLVAHYARQSKVVLPFKKGPDYIDAGWLSLASGRSCFNLDPYLMEREDLVRSFQTRAAEGEIIIVEGNRGLYDGVDAHGGYSTAELAKLLKLPVLLVVDCTKTTRTVAALVLGCKHLDPDVDICGVVLNRIGSSRHEKIVREAVETYTGVPVLGAYRRSPKDIFPMRHLGVIPFQEYEGAGEAVMELAQGAEDNLDIVAIENQMVDLGFAAQKTKRRKALARDSLKIGVLRDAAFQFYYPENLRALEEEGAEVVEVNSLTANRLPIDLAALYIGGGFPETSARILAENESFRRSVKEAAEAGLPIYAECGGLIYLGEKISLDGEEFPLVGVFPVHFTLEHKPQAHGYTVLTARNNNPFYQNGTRIKGHEFRYSRVAYWPGNPDELALDMERGVGFVAGGDGLVYKNVLALYTHIHAIGTPEWAPALVAKAREFKQQDLAAV